MTKIEKVSFCATVSFCFIGTVSFCFIEVVSFCFIVKKEKNPLAVFIINTCLYNKVSIISYLWRKKDPTYGEKTDVTSYLWRKNLKQICPLNRQICPVGINFFTTIKINITTQKLDK